MRNDVTVRSEMAGNVIVLRAFELKMFALRNDDIQRWVTVPRPSGDSEFSVD